MKKNQNGFSVLEILVVIAVIGFVGFIGFLGYSRVKDTQSDAKSNNNESSEIKQDHTGGDEPKQNTISKLSKEGYKNCGSADYTNVANMRVSTNDPVTGLSDCFEESFATCEKASFYVIGVPSGVTAEYTIEGINARTNLCRGGYRIVQHFQKQAIGSYEVCDLDQSIKPFMKAFAQAGTGLSTEVEMRCDSN